MKIRLDVDNKVFEYDQEPMPPERFNALCKLAGGGYRWGCLSGSRPHGRFLGYPLGSGCAGSGGGV